MQNGTSAKRYSLEEICPYLFEKGLNMVSFPQHCEILKYDKCDGKTNPQDHIREFCTISMEFAYNETYLMRLFPRSLSGKSMEWFSLNYHVGLDHLKSFKQIHFTILL